MFEACLPSLEQIAVLLRSRAQTLATAESCTGGLIAAACTSLPGSSDWFERGWVSYSNAAKSELLGVPAALIEAHGAVSEPVVRAMAAGALAHSPADWALAVTGIAGPSGAVPGKPVGTVWLALVQRGQPPQCWLMNCRGDRSAVRAQTLQRALDELRTALATA